LKKKSFPSTIVSPKLMEVTRSAISLKGSFFNTQRMLQKYYINEYFPEKLTHTPGEFKPALA